MTPTRAVEAALAARLPKPLKAIFTTEIIEATEGKTVLTSVYAVISVVKMLFIANDYRAASAAPTAGHSQPSALRLLLNRPQQTIRTKLYWFGFAR